MSTRRTLLRSASFALAGLPITKLMHAAPVGSPVPAHTAVNQLLAKTITQIYSDLKAQSLNASHINLLAGHLPVMFANMEDDGTMAIAQAAWHPTELAWSAQHTASLVSGARAMGMRVKPALFDGYDQALQETRGIFPLQVSEVLSTLSPHLLSAGQKIQSMGGAQAYKSWGPGGPSRIQPASFNLRGKGHYGLNDGCPPASWAVAAAAVAAVLVLTGVPQLVIAAQAIAAAAAIERLLDQYTTCDTQLAELETELDPYEEE